MLRLLVVVLLAANLSFFAWARGWLAPALPPPHSGEREPERLAAQVRPESVQLYTPQSASAAVASATPACVEAGPFDEAGIAAAEAALAAAGVAAGAATRLAVPAAPVWLVHMGRYTDAAQLRAKEDELRRIQVVFDVLQTPAALAPGLALSRHDSREAADAALAALAQRGVRTARVTALPAAAPQQWLRVPAADGPLRTRLQALLQPPQFDAAFAPCQTRP